MKKKVTFDDNIVTYTTYSPKEYDRLCIDSILYQKCHKKISDDDWNIIMRDLFLYKTFEMTVHIVNLVN